MGPIICLETSVSKSTLSNIPEDLRSHLQLGGSLKLLIRTYWTGTNFPPTVDAIWYSKLKVKG